MTSSLFSLSLTAVLEATITSSGREAATKIVGSDLRSCVNAAMAVGRFPYPSFKFWGKELGVGIIGENNGELTDGFNIDQNLARTLEQSLEVALISRINSASPELHTTRELAHSIFANFRLHPAADSIRRIAGNTPLLGGSAGLVTRVMYERANSGHANGRQLAPEQLAINMITMGNKLPNNDLSIYLHPTAYNKSGGIQGLAAATLTVSLNGNTRAFGAEKMYSGLLIATDAITNMRKNPDAMNDFAAANKFFNQK